MTLRQPPRLALALLERLYPDSEPLAGDLIEEFARRPSRLWFWCQVLAALAAVRFARTREIRPLRLVDMQPADAIERTRRLALRFRPVTMNGSPLSGAGGLSLAIFAGLLTSVVPGAWLVLLGSALAGSALGLVATRCTIPGRDR